MPLEIAMKTEELIRALAMDSTLPRKSNAAVGIAAAISDELMGAVEMSKLVTGTSQYMPWVSCGTV